MKRKVTEIKKKVHSTQFAKKYKRYSRKNNDLSPDNVPDEMRCYSPEYAEIPGCLYAVTKGAPSDEFFLMSEHVLSDILPCFNEVLIYRMLKLFYGDPDVLGAYMATVIETPMPGTIDWGYVLEIQHDLLVEIRSFFYDRSTYIRFWYITQPKVISEKNKAVEAGKEFIEELSEAVKNNLHLFNEEEDIKRTADLLPQFQLSLCLNIYAEKYHGAERLLKLASEFDLHPNRWIPKADELVPARSTGSMYLAAAMLFIVAIEALVNTLYTLLLKTDFADKRYERMTVRSHLDIRILSIHLFCRGFDKQPIAPGTDLWQRLITLIDFRNDVFHGNITEEDEGHIIVEDMFIFYYYPAYHFRGSKKSAAKSSLPRRIDNIDREVVLSLKQTADDIKDAIIGAMNEDMRSWAHRWIEEKENFIRPLPSFMRENNSDDNNE